jgi:hypothetical protein
MKPNFKYDAVFGETDRNMKKNNMEANMEGVGLENRPQLL